MFTTHLAVTYIGLGLVFTILGIVLIRMARLSAAGKVHRNWWIGVRTPFTLSSDTAWYTEQREAAPSMVIGGIGMAVGGCLFLVVTLIEFVVALPLRLHVVTVFATVAWLLLWVIVGAVRGLRAAHAAVNAEHQRDPQV